MSTNTHADELDLLRFKLELAQMKYECELRREDSLIQQGSHMQSAFSFITAALFMIAPVVVDNRGELSYKYLLAVFSSISLFLLISLIAATVSQSRKNQYILSNVEAQDKYIDSNFEKLSTETERLTYKLSIYERIESSLEANNQNRVEWIRVSMNTFYCSIGLSIIWFISSVYKLYF